MRHPSTSREGAAWRPLCRCTARAPRAASRRREGGLAAPSALARLLGGAALALVLPAASAAGSEPDALPWRCQGRPSFTVDAAAFPDSADWRLEVFVRIPPEPLAFVLDNGERRARLRLRVRLANRFGARLHEATQDFAVSEAELASSFGHVVAAQFRVKPGDYRLQVELHDLGSRKRGLVYVGRKVTESAQLEGALRVPGDEHGTRMGDLEFLWKADPGVSPSPFVRGGVEMLPNPERLFGLFASSLRAYLAAGGSPDDPRPWRWHARIYRGQEVVADREGSGAAGPGVEDVVEMDISTLPAGSYELEVKLWREGAEAALARRARFSIAWQLASWRRNPRDLEDEVHFLLDEDQEQSFAQMSPGEQEAFIEDFWRRRDPTPGTAENEARTSYLERVAYANDHFGHKKLEKGMFTDMGRVYIRYGPPSDIQRQVVPAGDKTLVQVIQELALTEDAPLGSTVRTKGLGGDIRPFEVWIYEGAVPLPVEADPDVTSHVRRRERLLFLFVDEQGYGRYTLRYSTE